VALRPEPGSRKAIDDARGQDLVHLRRQPRHRHCTGNAFLCEDVLAADGVTDFDRYAYQPGTEPEADLFVDHA
jgi:hypothetical protein